MLLTEETSTDIKAKVYEKLRDFRQKLYNPTKDRLNLNVLLDDTFIERREYITKILPNSTVQIIIDEYLWFRKDPVLVSYFTSLLVAVIFW